MSGSKFVEISDIEDETTSTYPQMYRHGVSTPNSRRTGMGMGVQIVSNDEYAATLAQAHFQLEPGIDRIVQLDSDREELPDEPLKLIEVNRDTAAIGPYPIYFASRADGAAWYPPVVIYEVSPEEYNRIMDGQLKLPHGARIRREFSRIGA